MNANPLSKRINQVRYFSTVLMRYKRAFGFRGIFLMLKLYKKNFQKSDRPIAIKLDNMHSIQVRPTSDLGVFNQVFVDKEYDLPLDQSVNTILDCGANVGYASVYLAQRYPNAKIISVEPLNSTFDMLRENTEDLDKVTPILGAVWKESTSLEIIDPSVASVAIQVDESTSENNSNKIQAYTIGQLAELTGKKTIDLLKLDIEGAEAEIFKEPEFLKFVRYIAIEFHNGIKRGSEKMIREKLTEYGYSETSVVGENVIFCCEPQSLAAA